MPKTLSIPIISSSCLDLRKSYTVRLYLLPSTWLWKLWNRLQSDKIRRVRVAINYLKEVRVELSKVIWPKREEVTKLSLIVVIISLIVSFYVGILDYAFVQIIEKII